MRLSSFTDYGLRMLMRMASHPERSFSTAELADEFELSRHHLAKIVQRLSQSGIVETRRGAGGGAVLAQAPETIRLGDIVRHLEKDNLLVSCLGPTGGTCVVDGRCSLKARLRRAQSAFYADLDRSTLADVALSPAASFHLPKAGSPPANVRANTRKPL